MKITDLNEALQDLIDIAEDDLINNIRTHQDKLVKEVIRLINRQRSGLILDDQGRVVTTGARGKKNRKRLVAIRGELDKLSNNKTIRRNIDEYVSAYVEIEKLYASYYTDISKSFTQAPIKEIAEGAKTRVKEILIGGLNSDLAKPVDNIINLALEGSLLDSIEDELEGVKTELKKKGRGTEIVKRGHFERYVNNQVLANHTGHRHKVRDSLHGFSGAITNAVTDQLGLEWIYYGGPKDKSNRDFCEDRVRGYYHINEVKGWSKKEWDGKNPFYNESNYLEIRGGYNCRHAWIPTATEQVPKKWIERAIKLGFYEG